jgi:hypothetical protein
MKTLIIAEAGVNHNGDLNIALELVRRAAEAGADLIKFQTFKTGRSIARHAPKAEYQKQTTGTTESQYEMVSRLELSVDDHHKLMEECRRCGIGFFSTAFDRDSHDLLISLGIDRVKIPSGELTNLPLMRHMTREGLPVILSTGMATLGEIESALAIIEGNGVAREKVTILHCTTEYPAPMTEVNLRAMQTLSAAFGTAVGYSDHTEGIAFVLLSELSKALEDLAGVQQIMAQRKDQLTQTELRAPLHGIVKNVRVTTRGGVIRPGEEVMQIVPLEEDLVIEAKVSPVDIAFIKTGMKATVKIDAYDYTIYGDLSGTLSYISADTLTENLNVQQGEQPYYRVQVKTDGRKFSGRPDQKLDIQPGMTSMVEIKTGSNTVLKYLSKPVIKTLNQSMGER